VKVELTEDSTGFGEEGEVIETTFNMAQALIRAGVAKVPKGGEEK